MATQGWWSGDLHLHRPPDDAKTLLAAEDLNLGVFFTMWNTQSLWQGKEIPADPVVRLDATHVATLMNAEDERGGGAWMMHNLKKPLDMSAAERWYPQGRVFVDEAKAQGAWFRLRKARLVGGTHHGGSGAQSILSVSCTTTTISTECLPTKPGAARGTQKLYPGNDGFSNYSLGLYYRYLNLGLRLPASAGSASGVLPSPPGYNRVYVYVPEGFSVAAFYSALGAGRCFVTNGPILAFTVNGKILRGTLVEIQSDRPLRIAAGAKARSQSTESKSWPMGRWLRMPRARSWRRRLRRENLSCWLLAAI